MSPQELRALLLPLFGAAALACAFILAVKKLPARVVFVFGLVAATVCLIIDLPELRLLTLGPLTAEVRDLVTETNVTLAQLRELSVTLSKPILGSVEAQGRIGGGPRRENYETRNNVVENLRKIGVSQDRIDEATSQFDMFVFYNIYADSVEDANGGKDYYGENKPAAKCLTDALKPSDEHSINFEFDTATNCLKLLGPIPEILADDLADLRQIKDKRTLRRPQVYFARDH